MLLPEDASEDASFSGRQEQDSVAAAPGPVQSLSECSTLDELFSAVMSQADSMSGREAAKGLARLVNLSRGRAHKVRGAPALSTLYAALERSSEDLGPKVLQAARDAVCCWSCNDSWAIGVMLSRFRCVCAFL